VEPENKTPGSELAEDAGVNAGKAKADFNPMDQFEIERIIPINLFGYDISFTNSSLWMVIAAAAVSGLLILAMRDRALVPGRLQSMAEMAYEFVAKMVRDNTGREGMPYFPFIFTLFMFILFMNLFGMIPGSFTATSHIIVTFALAAVVTVGITILGFVKNGAGFLKLFVPSGVPVWLMPLLVPIEVFSYIIRPVSLSVRLFANMMAGHTMLKVFASFVVALGFVGGWVPLIFMVAFTGLEILIAFLQAFVFAVLACIYLNDALHMHH
jgi:F-type H+-transporting ATPase subunit a